MKIQLISLPNTDTELLVTTFRKFQAHFTVQSSSIKSFRYLFLTYLLPENCSNPSMAFHQTTLSPTQQSQNSTHHLLN